MSEIGHPPAPRHRCAEGMMGARLDSAYRVYWDAPTRTHEAAAYWEIIARGGQDGYPNGGPVRQAVGRWLRRLAAWVERR